MDRLYGAVVTAALREVPLSSGRVGQSKKSGGPGWLKQVWDAMFSWLFSCCGGMGLLLGYLQIQVCKTWFFAW
jgi:hypothetical protein